MPHLKTLKVHACTRARACGGYAKSGRAACIAGKYADAAPERERDRRAAAHVLRQPPAARGAVPRQEQVSPVGPNGHGTERGARDGYSEYSPSTGAHASHPSAVASPIAPVTARGADRRCKWDMAEAKWDRVDRCGGRPDCSRRLTKLLGDVYVAKYLRSLDLSPNRLSRLPLSLGRMEKLQACIYICELHTRTHTHRTHAHTQPRTDACCMTREMFSCSMVYV